MVRKFDIGDQPRRQPARVLRVQVMPIIHFLHFKASVSSVLFGVMQIWCALWAIVLQKVMGARGAEIHQRPASISLDRLKPALTIRQFLEGLTESELFTITEQGNGAPSQAAVRRHMC